MHDRTPGAGRHRVAVIRHRLVEPHDAIEIPDCGLGASRRVKRRDRQPCDVACAPCTSASHQPGATPWVIAPGDGHAYLETVIRSVALLARRVAGPPDRLVRSLAVLAMLVVAAAALMAAPRPARAAPVAGPACWVTSQAVAVLSDARGVETRKIETRKAGSEARRALFDGTDLCPADLEVVGELGLPRRPVEAPRPRHVSAASYGYAPAVAPASGPDEALHRPPRAA